MVETKQKCIEQIAAIGREDLTMFGKNYILIYCQRSVHVVLGASSHFVVESNSECNLNEQEEKL